MLKSISLAAKIVNPSISFAQIMGNKRGNKVDAAVFVRDTSSITGVVEIKIPGSNLDQICQIVDYMVDLRISFNVCYVFGVYKTYEAWKILSIRDGTVKIFQLKTYQFDDPGTSHFRNW